jgi:hypothetical protein
VRRVVPRLARREDRRAVRDFRFFDLEICFLLTLYLRSRQPARNEQNEQPRNGSDRLPPDKTAIAPNARKPGSDSVCAPRRPRGASTPDEQVFVWCADQLSSQGFAGRPRYSRPVISAA